MNNVTELLYFDSFEEAENFLFSELIATLQDDLERMTNDKYEREHYTDEDRAIMRAKILDLQTLEERAASMR